MGFELTTLVVIGTDCIGSYKSNYHTIPALPRWPLHVYYIFFYIYMVEEMSQTSGTKVTVKWEVYS
jgi:hypothetical protein